MGAKLGTGLVGFGLVGLQGDWVGLQGDCRELWERNCARDWLGLAWWGYRETAGSYGSETVHQTHDDS
eukprot:2811624-Pleurochrysis_carterae.AAC.1